MHSTRIIRWLSRLACAVSLVMPACLFAQSDRAAVGDLVEFTSGLGPMLAEIVVGPDAAGYVVIQLPTGKQVPVNTTKLRLIQKAGTPNAAMSVGEAVAWTSGGVKERGHVTKVNGIWCQVTADSATTIGWLECSSLRTAAQASAAKPAPAAKPAGRKLAPAALLGKWENADGMFKLEFQGAGKCFLSMGPMSGPCTYASTDSGVTITFDGDDLVLAANSDGSLSSDGGADGMMPMRFTRK